MTQRDWLILGGGIIAGVALGATFPKARKHLGPIIEETGHRAGSLLSGIAEVIAAQMEKAEDFAAERKAAANSEV